LEGDGGRAEEVVFERVVGRSGELVLSFICELCLGKELLFLEPGGGGAGRFTFDGGGGGLLILNLSLLNFIRSSWASGVFMIRSAFSHNFIARSDSFSAAACFAFFLGIVL